MANTGAAYSRFRDLLEKAMSEQRQLTQQGEAGLGQYGGSPFDFYNQAVQGYQESPYLQSQIDYGQHAANAAAAASGMLGSGAELQHAAERAQGMRGQDFQNYLNRIMQLRGMGLQSSEDILRANQMLGGQLGQGYGAMGETYLGEAQQPSWWDELSSWLGSGVGAVAGGAAGGPAGAMMGAKMGSHLFGG